RALALLPAETRSVLIERYVLESPLADVAAHLGVHTSVAAMRLQRGKLALRHVLETNFERDLAEYHLGMPTPDHASRWHETSRWCMSCRQHHLKGSFDPVEGELWLTCPACCPEPDDFMVHTHSLAILGGVKGYKPAYSRVFTWSRDYYWPNLMNPTLP